MGSLFWSLGLGSVQSEYLGNENGKEADEYTGGKWSFARVYLIVFSFVCSFGFWTGFLSFPNLLHKKLATQPTERM